MADSDAPVAFLFTDLQGSTRSWEEDPQAMANLIEEHDRTMTETVGSNGGVVVKQTGDGVFAVFERTNDAISAAVEAQLNLSPQLKARMGIHYGSALRRGNDYFGNDVNRAARLMAIAHGGQIIVSANARSDIRQGLGDGVALTSLGTHRLKDLTDPIEVFQVLADGLETEFPPLRSLEGVPNNLPAEISSFIGREADIEAVADLLSTHRLVSLTGAGGSGKTRLALQVAAEVVADFEDGAWFVDLAGLTEPELVPLAVSTTLSLSEKAGREWLDVLIDHVSSKRILIILDNCEHLLDVVAGLAETVLTSAPQLQMLATTREPLNVAGEVAWRVPTLDLPEKADFLSEALSYESVRLFVERALAAKPDLALGDSDVPAILEICRRLDGLPLALELAAARVRALSIREIADNLSDRFSLLTGGARTALPRHRTLEGAVSWSYESLTEPEQDTLRRLSVFSGGFGLPGAQVLAGESALTNVTALVDKSLLSAKQAKGETRYRMLETVAAFAYQRLGDDAANARNTHLQWATMFAAQAFQHLDGPDQVEWLDRVALELDNLRAAMQWSLDGGEPALGTLIAGSLYRFWYIRGVREGRRWLDLFIAAEPEIDPATRGRILFAVGSLTQSMGEYERAAAQLRQSMEILESEGEERGWAYALHYLIRAVWGTSSAEELREMVDTALEVFRRLGDRVGTSVTLLFDSLWHLQYGSLEDIPITELRDVTRDTRAPQLIAHAAEIPAAVAWYKGDVDAAAPLLAEAAAIYKVIQNQQCAGHCLENGAGWAAKADKPTEAAILLGAATALREDTGIPTPGYEKLLYEEVVEEVRGALGDAFDERWNTGASMSMDQALDYIIEITAGVGD